MQAFSQKYAIIQSFEPLTIGDRFSSSDWPLHTTIADTFAVDWSDELWQKLSTVIAEIKPLSTGVGDDDHFGVHGETTVTLLQLTPALTQLHTSVVHTLTQAGAVFNDPQYTGAGFKPHATVQRHARLNRGSLVHFTELNVIDMFPGNDPHQRKVIRSLPLARN